MVCPRLFVLPIFVLVGCPDDADGETPATTMAATETGEEGGTEHADHGESGEGEASGSTSDAVSTSSGGAEASSSSSGDPSGTSGSTADTWENWALPSFFAMYCNQCHPAAGQSMRDFSDYDTVAKNVEHIRCGTAPEAIEGCDAGHIEPGHLPIGPGPYPTDEERWRLVDWIDAGMPQD
jgi:hypothetical protein